MAGGHAGQAAETIVVPARFNGPPGSANGGYVGGLLAARLGGAVAVTLRAPPPLGRPLSLQRRPDGLVLRDGDALIAEAEPTAVDLDPPARVGVADAARAMAGYRGLTAHPFPTCVVCGPERAPGDGLRLFPGPVAGTPVVATTWTPAADLADRSGVVTPEIVWAALDCPSYFGGAAGILAVLGRLAVDLRHPVLAGRPHVVLGWGLGSERRKHHGAAAVTDAAGTVLAVSRATWVALADPAAFQ